MAGQEFFADRRRAGQRELLDLGGQHVADRCIDQIRRAAARQFDDDVVIGAVAVIGEGLDRVGIVVGAAVQRVGARPTIQLVGTAPPERLSSSVPPEKRVGAIIAGKVCRRPDAVTIGWLTAERMGWVFTAANTPGTWWRATTTSVFRLVGEARPRRQACSCLSS